MQPRNSESVSNDLASSGSVYNEFEQSFTADKSDDLDRASIGDKRTPLRHMFDALEPASDSQDPEEKRKLKRKQMRKDLHKLNRCMARTGAAAMAASMLGGPLESVARMDETSRFRRQHRPPIPELFVDEYTAVATLSELTKEPKPIRSYRSFVLDSGSLTEFPSPPPSVAPSLSVSEACQADRFIDGKADVTRIVGSEVMNDCDINNDPEGQCSQTRCSEGAGELITHAIEKSGANERQKRGSLRQIHRRVRRPRDLRPSFISWVGSVCRFRRRFSVASARSRSLGLPSADVHGGAADTAGKGSIADAYLGDKASDSAWFSQQGASTPTTRIIAAAYNGPARIAAQCRASVSTLADAFGAAPRQHVASPRGLWSAATRAVRGADEERSVAQLVVCCSMAFVVSLLLSCACLVLLALAFSVGASGDGTDEDMETSTGTLASQGRTKSWAFSRVLTIALISLFAGNGLAVSHPVRDAFLCGI